MLVDDEAGGHMGHRIETQRPKPCRRFELTCDIGGIDERDVDFGRRRQPLGEGRELVNLLRRDFERKAVEKGRYRIGSEQFGRRGKSHGRIHPRGSGLQCPQHGGQSLKPHGNFRPGPIRMRPRPKASASLSCRASMPGWSWNRRSIPPRARQAPWTARPV